MLQYRWDTRSTVDLPAVYSLLDAESWLSGPMSVATAALLSGRVTGVSPSAIARSCDPSKRVDQLIEAAYVEHTGLATVTATRCYSWRCPAIRQHNETTLRRPTPS